MIFVPGRTEGYIILERETPTHGYELDLDAYYTSFEFYMPFRKKKREYVQEESEISMYKALFKRAVIPQFILTEVSVYPFPCLGVYLKENQREFYTSARIGKSFNWIQSLCAGFEEPWAFSLLLGNLVNFRPEGSHQSHSGKAYLGYLASFGAYHIKDNVLIDDNWVEIEWKIKGDRIIPGRKMSWSFRTGGKHHGNRNIKDTLYLSIRRERVDYSFYNISLLKNSSLEYTMDFGADFKNIVRHYFLFGKNFPFKNRKVIFILQFGVIKEWEGKYTGSLKREEEGENLYYVIRPNVKF